jgi:RHS repeat-associated protein
VRSGASSGYPNTRYCANLGHKQDDESGLIYMRARYYEPWTGRFVSEDPARDGINWFVYCGNNAVHRVDDSGREYEDDSFDPVYIFKWQKWWKHYWSSAFMTGGSFILASWKRTPIGFIIAYVLAGIRGGFLGAVIVELWSLRTLAWYAEMFGDLPEFAVSEPIVGDLPLLNYYHGPVRG